MAIQSRSDAILIFTNVPLMKLFEYYIATTLKIGIITILILAASLEHQYSYYEFVRWSTSFSSLYLLYRSYKLKQTGLAIFYIALILLFNPFLKVHFQRQTWQLIDYIAALTLLLTSIYELFYLIKQNNKQHE